MDTLKAAGSPAARAGGPLTVAKIGSWAVAGATARTNAPSRRRPIARGRGDRSSPLAGQVDADGDRGRRTDRDRDERGIQGRRPRDVGPGTGTAPGARAGRSSVKTVFAEAGGGACGGNTRNNGAAPDP